MCDPRLYEFTTAKPALPRTGRPERMATTLDVNTAGDAEAIASALKLTTARVRRLAAAIEAEEGALVQGALVEAEVVAAARSSNVPGSRPHEQRLQARVGQTRQLLRAERSKLQEDLAHGNTQLALAIEHGVDEYYSDVRGLRRERREVQGAAAGAAQPGSELYRLREEERRLGDAVRSLSAEIEALATEEAAAVASRSELLEAIRTREQRGAAFG